MRNARECPRCCGDSKVTNTRDDKKGNRYRIRECLDCRHQWKTYEVFAEQVKDEEPQQ